MYTYVNNNLYFLGNLFVCSINVQQLSSMCAGCWSAFKLTELPRDKDFLGEPI